MSATATAIDVMVTWQQLRQDWRQRLARHGVEDIGELSSPPGCMQLQLIYLRAHLGHGVDKHEMALWMRQHNSTCGLDPQARHWKAKGWDVQGRSGVDGLSRPLPNGYYCLTSLGPSTEFLTKRTRELGRIAATDWDTLKLVYNNRCGMCGANGVSLEQGHMDPNQPLELTNTIPLCTDCNRWQLDRFVIDDRGRVVTVLPVEANKALFKGLDQRERRQLSHMLSG
jgi:hypothetical protein